VPPERPSTLPPDRSRRHEASLEADFQWWLAVNFPEHYRRQQEQKPRIAVLLDKPDGEVIGRAEIWPAEIESQRGAWFW
jgi:hypothetical protein